MTNDDCVASTGAEKFATPPETMVCFSCPVTANLIPYKNQQMTPAQARSLGPSPSVLKSSCPTHRWTAMSKASCPSTPPPPPHPPPPLLPTALQPTPDPFSARTDPPSVRCGGDQQHQTIPFPPHWTSMHFPQTFPGTGLKGTHRSGICPVQTR